MKKVAASGLAKSYVGWITLLLVISVTSLIRLRLLNVPFERDEGEYAYAGTLLLQGVLPYAGVYSMKLPGTYCVYALFLALFGHSVSAVHLGLLIANVGTALLIYLLGKRLFDHGTGIVAAASYAVMSLSPSVLGTAAHATHFVMLFALSGILLLMRACESGRKVQFFVSGLFLGLSILMKQHGMAFALFSLFYATLRAVRRHGRVQSSLPGPFLLLSGIVFPYGVIAVFFYLAGAFDKFWFLTVTYPREYVSMLPLTVGLGYLKANFAEIVKTNLMHWLFALVGLIALCSYGEMRGKRLFFLSFFLSSFLAVCPGFYFREHYFIQLLPATALLVGLGVTFLFTRIANYASRLTLSPVLAIVPVFILLQPLFPLKDYYFSMQPAAASRFIYKLFPFPESLVIAKHIKERTVEGDRIAVLGSEPQIYFYADRRAATGFIYTYPLMEPHKFAFSMLNEMFYEIEASSPKYLVWVNPDSWAEWVVPDSQKRYVDQWITNYIQKNNYKRIGVVDVISDKLTVYKWGNEALDYSSRSTNWLYIYEKNNFP